MPNSSDEFFDDMPTAERAWFGPNQLINATKVLSGKAPSEAVVVADPAQAANPKQRYGDLKPAVHLVPPALVLGAAVALKEGAQKYGAYNWRNSKVEALTYVGAIGRHLAAYLDGEDVDPESAVGKLHLDGIAACVAILLDAYHGGFLLDNRPPPGPAPRLVLTPPQS